MTNFILFVLISLAVWRVSSLVAREDGPFEIFARFRSLIGVDFDAESEMYGKNGFARGVICVWCNSIWFSAIGATLVASSVLEWIMYTLAMSTVAILVDKQAVG